MCYHTPAPSLFVPKKSRKLHRTLKNSFIPHKGNNYHPHLLRSKHALWYGIVFLVLKIALVIFALSIPLEAFTTPNVIEAQRTKLVTLTNQLRVEKGLSALWEVAPLDASALARAQDMNAQQYFSHVSPDGHRLDYFLSQAGYAYEEAGENLAMGFSDADAAMSAWMKSPTHYANLVDTGYQDLGIGVVAGVYHDQPTVFVAQHFGVPYPPSLVPPVSPSSSSTMPALPSETSPSSSIGGVIAHATSTPHGQIAGLTIQDTTHATSAAPPSHASVMHPSHLAVLPSTIVKPTQSTERIAAPSSTAVIQTPGRATSEEIAPSPSVTAAVLAPSNVPLAYQYDADHSFVTWQDEGDHTLVHVQAHITGQVGSARTIVNGYPIDLIPQEDGNLYVGSLTIAEPLQDVFRAIVASSLEIKTPDGAVHDELIEWQNPKIVSVTPWQRYLQARSWLYTTIPVFPLVHGFYVVALTALLVMFSLAVVVEIRKQHPHLILRTLGLLALLIWCVKF